MNPIRLAVERPIAVAAITLMALLAGLVALLRMPVQLAPDVTRPVISVFTSWPGAAPVEVEREIVERQEEALKDVEGVIDIQGSARAGSGRVTLTFPAGHDMSRALVLVNNRLSQLSGYPAEVREPALSSSTTEDTPIAEFVITRLPGNTAPIERSGRLVEDIVQARMERIPGVAEVDVSGGAALEMQVIVQPERMARFGLTVPEIVDALRAAGISASAGDLDEGKRRYVVRTEGRFERPEQVAQVGLRSLSDPATGRVARITVADVAEVRLGYKPRGSVVRHKGEPALFARIVRETGANVIAIMEAARAAAAELDRGELRAHGLTITLIYDDTVYIARAIDLVVSDIWIGGVLAVAVLLLFLRAIGVTLVVAAAIPICVVASFAGMALTGRTLNVVSLAGLAFSVGMMVDSAIVVAENTFRLRENGLSAFEAAYQGAKQVWGAILISAITTMLVFVPIMVTELEIGQLFADIAVAISVSNVLALVVAVTVLPALARRLIVRPDAGPEPGWRIPLLDAAAAACARSIMAVVRAGVRRRGLGLVTVASFTAASLGLAWLGLPKLEYLPESERGSVFGRFIPPPGYNLGTMAGIAERIETATRPHWVAPGADFAAGGPVPAIDNFTFWASRTSVGISASTPEAGRASELVSLISKPGLAEPGTFGITGQPSLFGRGIGGGRSIVIDIRGPDLDRLLDVARSAVERLQAVLPREDGHQVRPDPGLEYGAPEIRLYPDRVRLADADVSARNLAETVDAFNDGLRVSEITVDGRRVDLTLKGPPGLAQRTQSIDTLPIVTGRGQILPAQALAEVVVTAGPTEIRHVERQRAISVHITPAATLPLESAMALVAEQVLAPLEAAGLPPGVVLDVTGTADQLKETFGTLMGDLGLAAILVFLVMAVLLESFLYPLVIMVSVPLAAAGGVLGLVVLRAFTGQTLDMLTLLGFVILIGIVVNNAILIVHQALYNRRIEGMPPAEAILEATRDRLRPIFMSTATTVVGMLPLVLAPGAGAEIYRGIGAVIVGGLSLSAVLTLFLVPPLLALAMGGIGRTAVQRRSALIAAPAE